MKKLKELSQNEMGEVIGGMDHNLDCLDPADPMFKGLVILIITQYIAGAIGFYYYFCCTPPPKPENP